MKCSLRRTSSKSSKLPYNKLPVGYDLQEGVNFTKLPCTINKSLALFPLVLCLWSLSGIVGKKVAGCLQPQVDISQDC